MRSSATDRQTINDINHVWPVNVLAFRLVYLLSLFLHSYSIHLPNFMSADLHLSARYNTFTSAGLDGTVSIWNHKVKR